MLHIHPHAVQRPTHSSLHVRDMHDAHVLLEAVRLHLLQPVTRRLNEVERMSFIRSGSVFVWEESDDDSGLRRWTDGFLWSASRMREPFLFYETRTLLPRSPSHPGLVKQTYSALVTLPSAPGSPPVVRKWHLTAYLDQNTLADLQTIDTDPIFAGIALPPGMYRSGKSRQRQNTSESSGGLRWINVDGSNGNAMSRRTPYSSPDTSTAASSPSHSPIMSASSRPETTVDVSYGSQAFPFPPSYQMQQAPVYSLTRPSVAQAYLSSSQKTPTLPPIEVGFVEPQMPPPSTRPSLRMRSPPSEQRSPEDLRVLGLLNSRTSYF